jgi:hypothetical protein
MQKNKIKILFLDIETFPMECYHWRMFDPVTSLKMIKQHTSMASWAAKWAGKAKIYYQDVKNQKNLRDDSKICKGLQDKINEADIIVGHNIHRFDKKKSNYRFLVNGLKPTRPNAIVDTWVIIKKHFGFDSSKLEHVAKILNLKYQKVKHEKFAGEELWTECLNRNPAAWKEMKHYNKYDVLVLEEAYKKLIPWDNAINFNVYNPNNENRCQCGSFVVVKEGQKTFKTKVGSYQQYSCKTCGHWWTGRTNLLTALKRSGMLK